MCSTAFVRGNRSGWSTRKTLRSSARSTFNGGGAPAFWSSFASPQPPANEPSIKRTNVSRRLRLIGLPYAPQGDSISPRILLDSVAPRFVRTSVTHLSLIHLHRKALRDSGLKGLKYLVGTLQKCYSFDFALRFSLSRAAHGVRRLPPPTTKLARRSVQIALPGASSLWYFSEYRRRA